MPSAVVLKRLETVRWFSLLGSAPIGFGQPVKGAMKRIFRFTLGHLQAPTSAQPYSEDWLNLPDRPNPYIVVKIFKFYLIPILTLNATCTATMAVQGLFQNGQ